MSTPQTPYQLLGERAIRELCNAFYDIMDTDPVAADIRRMHATDLTAMKGKLGNYLIEWMGGPPLYSSEHGGVCMTEPHAPYQIGPRERDQWLHCMNRALEQVEVSDQVRQMLEIPLQRIAAAVQNREDSGSAASNPNVIASN